MRIAVSKVDSSRANWCFARASGRPATTYKRRKSLGAYGPENARSVSVLRACASGLAL
jgi:hypothetical protein